MSLRGTKQSRLIILDCHSGGFRYQAKPDRISLQIITSDFRGSIKDSHRLVIVDRAH